MKTECTTNMLLLGLLLGATAGGGCSARLARENIFANTESAFGLTIAENPQTQIYELKLGYARHELFYVPTSKLLFYEKAGTGVGNEKSPGSLTDYNDPSKTPEVLAEIQIGGSSGGTNRGFQIRQRLAIGKEAVNSDAATALLAPEAATAQAIASLEDPTRMELRDELDALLKKPLTGTATAGGQNFSGNQTRNFAEAKARELTNNTRTLMSVRRAGREPLRKLVEELKKVTQ